MDRRSWPWKKKSSDKAAAEKAAAAADAAAASLCANASQSEESYKKPKYVQISVEQYAHLTGLEDEVKSYEDHVKTLEDQINELEENLSAANTEMTNKDNLVKQHAKVAEEAVSGWEKAEAEAVALKTHLETVTLSKLTVEDRAAHLDGALKECMRQIRNLKEENEQKLQDLAVTKNKQCEKIKHELEARLADLDQDLRRAAAENAAISRSLKERSNMLIKISEEKTQAEAEIELLKGNIESCEREINSLKYELHVSAKELEIRTEEKNMSMRSAEVANKQHVEGVKKIAKLEAECQRLRGLVRKKLPGPAALAQMKMEVESLGRDYGDTRVRRSPVKPSSPHLSPVTEFSLDHVQKYQKENEFLAERLLATEEETKMLKEALAKRNSELQVSRSMYAKAASRLQSLEAQIQISGQHKTSPKSIQISTEGSFSHNTSHPASLTSMSEDGNDDDRSCAETWATGKANKPEKSNHLNLMDDFLEMEKLACLSNDSNGPVSVSNSTISKTTEVVNHDASEVISGKDIQTEQKSGAESAEHSPGTNAEQQPLMKLRSRISTLLESVSKDTDVGNILEDIKHAIQETHSTLHTETSLSDDEHQSDGRSDDRQANPEDAGLTTGKEISLSQPVTETGLVISKDLAAAISQIHDFVLFLGKEAMGVHDTFTEGNEFSQRIEEFSITFKKAIGQNLSLIDFILDLSRVLAKASELRFNVLGFKGNGAETNSPDCIDKVALPENKILRKDSNEIYQNGCTSDPEVSDDGNIVSGYKSNVKASKISLEEFEQLKSEKENLLSELARCTENLEMTKSQLRETDQLLAEAKSQLASAQKSNSLSETQLKCMAESYRSLESRAAELETELNLLIAKTESIETELQDEKKNHHDALSRCKELQDQLLRNESNLENEVKTNQEKELAAAAEKLSEFQETIFLLGKQLKNFHPQSDFMGSPYNERSQKIEAFNEEEPTTSGINMTDHADLDTTVSPIVNRIGAESPIDVYNGPLSPSDAESSLLKSPINSKNPRQKSPISGSSSSSSNAPTPEKHSRGFSRFFSSKGKNGY